MLTVVIETLNDEEALARTLASLVGGSVEGVVREVMVRDLGSTDHTALVAEHAGCHMIAGELASGLKRTKGDWLLLLEPGARLLDGWTEAAIHHVSGQAGPARFTRSRIGRPSLLARLFGGSSPLADGLLVAKQGAVALARPGANLAAIARGLASKRLEAEIVPAPRRP